MPSDFVYLATVEWHDETQVVGVYPTAQDALAVFGDGAEWEDTDGETYWWRKSGRPVTDAECVERMTIGERSASARL